MPPMAKKKVSGKHSTPRKTIQIPADWVRVAQELAAERPMPVMWLIVELLKKEAEDRKRSDLPPVPWVLPSD